MYNVFIKKRPIFHILKSAEVVEAVRLGGTPTLELSDELCQSFTVAKNGHWNFLVIVGFQFGGSL
jgi:hypothetical protein